MVEGLFTTHKVLSLGCISYYTLNSQVVFWDIHHIFIIGLAYCMPLVCGELKNYCRVTIKLDKGCCFLRFKCPSLPCDRFLGFKRL